MEAIKKQLGRKPYKNMLLCLLAISENGVAFWELKIIFVEKSLGLTLLSHKPSKSAIYSVLKLLMDWIIC